MFEFINSYEHIYVNFLSLGIAPFIVPGYDLSTFQTPCPKKASYEISKLWHLQLTRRTFLKFLPV